MLRCFQWGPDPRLVKLEHLLVAIRMHQAVGAGLSMHSLHKFEGKCSCPPHPAGTGFLVSHFPALLQGICEDSEMPDPSHPFHTYILEQEEPMRSWSIQVFNIFLSGVGMAGAACC